MSQPLLIAVIITVVMVAAHIGVFWFFVFRENTKVQAEKNANPESSPEPSGKSGH